jgi:hypothetical protein
VCVHGAPHLVRWRQAVAALARESGLVVVGGGGRRAGATLLLSSLGVDVATVRDLRFEGGTGLHPPGAALSVLRLRGSEFVLAAATFVGNSAERQVQAHELQAAIGRLVPGDPPTVISAEGSDRVGTAAWQVLLENRTAVAGRVFVDGRIGVDEARPLQHAEPAAPSVVVELSLP